VKYPFKSIQILFGASVVSTATMQYC